MHVAFILSVRGIPQLYYGEEIAMEGSDDPDNRRDFPQRAFASQGRKPGEQKMFEWTRSWIRLRREHAAMRTGRLIDLFSDDETYVFARQQGDETFIVGINRQNQQKQLTIPARSIGVKDGVTLKMVIGGEENVRVVNGEARLNLPPRSAVALKAS